MTPRRKLAIAIVVGALSACGSERPPADPEPEQAEPAAAQPAPAQPGTTTPEPGTAAPGSTTADPAAATGDPVPAADACERARTCCPAYVAALPRGERGSPGERGTAEQACASLELAIASGGAPADAACQGALEGFRRSLEATGREIPPDCR